MASAYIWHVARAIPQWLQEEHQTRQRSGHDVSQAPHRPVEVVVVHVRRYAQFMGENVSDFLSRCTLVRRTKSSSESGSSDSDPRDLADSDSDSSDSNDSSDDSETSTSEDSGDEGDVKFAFRRDNLQRGVDLKPLVKPSIKRDPQPVVSNLRDDGDSDDCRVVETVAAPINPTPRRLPPQLTVVKEEVTLSSDEEPPVLKKQRQDKPLTAGDFISVTPKTALDAPLGKRMLKALKKKDRHDAKKTRALEKKYANDKYAIMFYRMFYNYCSFFRNLLLHQIKKSI